ncbi:MAG: BrnA antitoxin family protein [Candidatus Binatus sp.]|uniref:BrnA antitoxin family protein n=1 Tax=Candidatus Binatus sp. TaxID=2811406 RepID=UPI0027183548|nr:BrnA antitoxin family protein [Candidatus Binatus sp.]MDO8432922.1 BrnA antitoxin family protein [Candidatus Binatus sp.]
MRLSEEHIVRRLRPLIDSGKTDWKRVDALTDREIEEAIASDPDAAPLLDEEWFRTAKLVMPERKVPVSMRIDREVLDWFKRAGRGYLSRMHAVLRAYVAAQSKTKTRKASKTAKSRSQRKSAGAKSKVVSRARSKGVRRHAK